MLKFYKLIYIMECLVVTYMLFKKNLILYICAYITYLVCIFINTKRSTSFLNVLTFDIFCLTIQFDHFFIFISCCVVIVIDYRCALMFSVSPHSLFLNLPNH